MNKLHSFRKKPVVIKTVRFVGHNSTTIATFTEGFRLRDKLAQG